MECLWQWVNENKVSHEDSAGLSSSCRSFHGRKSQILQSVAHYWTPLSSVCCLPPLKGSADGPGLNTLPSSVCVCVSLVRWWQISESIMKTEDASQGRSWFKSRWPASSSRSSAAVTASLTYRFSWIGNLCGGRGPQEALRPEDKQHRTTRSTAWDQLHQFTEEGLIFFYGFHSKWMD